jgi:hypothetical protein
VFKRLAALTAPNGGALSRGCRDNCPIGQSLLARPGPAPPRQEAVDSRSASSVMVGGLSLSTAASNSAGGMLATRRAVLRWWSDRPASVAASARVKRGRAPARVSSFGGRPPRFG